jgi:TRAP-type transport system periplasmic protein
MLVSGKCRRSHLQDPAARCTSYHDCRRLEGRVYSDYAGLAAVGRKLAARAEAQGGDAMKRWMALGAGAIVAAGLVAAPVEAITLRVGSVLPADSDQGQAAEHFASRVAELTGGEVTVEVFHGGQLGPPPTQLENLIVGAQDMLIDTYDYFTAYDERFGLVNTPFVFRDRDHFQAFLGSDLFAELVASIEDQGMVFLGRYNWLRQQERGVLSRQPIFGPDDLQGVRMRMFQSEMPIQAWSAMGANIQVIPWADVYTALATGAVDSLTGVVSASYLNKHTEQVKYFTNVREYWQLVIPVISKISWDRLTPAQQEALVQAADEAGEVYVELSAALNDEHIRRAKSEHGLTLIDPPIEPWLEKAEEMHGLLEQRGLLPAGLVARAQGIE